MSGTDYITPAKAETLSGLFIERVKKSPDSIAYKQYDESKGIWIEKSWKEVSAEVAKWRVALKRENIAPGERVAIIMRNCMQWMFFDQGALASGLVVVPLYINDNPGNIAYILNNSGAKVLALENIEAWEALEEVHDKLKTVTRVVIVNPSDKHVSDSRVKFLDRWLPEGKFCIEPYDMNPDNLATIVYTSGTTGPPKGVMLSHRNIVSDAYSGARSVEVFPEDVFLSFLPLCHTLERTIGYYLPMMCGSTVAFARSVKQLAEDLKIIKPTMLISVPLIYQRIFDKIHGKLKDESSFKRAIFNIAVDVGWKNFLYKQKRGGWSPSLILWPLLNAMVGKKVMDGFGGRLRIAIAGGAPLPLDAARLFVGLGMQLLQGYGLTETSPVISVNRVDNNDPASIGPPLPGIDVKIDDNGEILTKSQSVMLGYWKNEEATREMIDADGWLHTGDIGKLENGRLYITDRLKQIIVMSNGKKVPPSDIENRLASIGLFDNAVVVGEGQPYLVLIAQLNPENWQALAQEYGLDPDSESALDDKKVLDHARDLVNERLKEMPAYAKIRSLLLTTDEWSVENGLLTPTLKTRRKPIVALYQEKIEEIYSKK